MIEYSVPAQSGVAFTVKRGQTFRIIDVHGQQVADLFCFNRHNLDEALSSGHTLDYNEKLFVTGGDTLYSNQGTAMLTLCSDGGGRHPMLYAPCNQKMYELSYGVTEPHPNCLDNFMAGLASYGVRASQLTVPLNIFMNISIDEAGHIHIDPAWSGAGTAIELQAEMDLLMGVTACSAGLCNGGHCTDIRIEVD